MALSFTQEVVRLGGTVSSLLCLEKSHAHPGSRMCPPDLRHVPLHVACGYIFWGLVVPSDFASLIDLLRSSNPESPRPTWATVLPIDG